MENHTKSYIISSYIICISISTHQIIIPSGTELLSFDEFLDTLLDQSGRGLEPRRQMSGHLSSLIAMEHRWRKLQELLSSE